VRQLLENRGVEDRVGEIGRVVDEEDRDKNVRAVAPDDVVRAALHITAVHMLRHGDAEEGSHHHLGVRTPRVVGGGRAPLGQRSGVVVVGEKIDGVGLGSHAWR
jgi:hypothetical protein